MKLSSKKKKPELEGAISSDVTKPSKNPIQSDGLKVDNTSHIAVSNMGGSSLTKKQKIFVFILLGILMITAATTLYVVDYNSKNQKATDAKKSSSVATTQEELKKITEKKVDPSKDPAAATAKAEAYKALGDNKAAVNEYDAIIEAKKSTYDTYVGRSYALAATGDLDGAIKSLEEAQRLLIADTSVNADVKKSELDKINNKIVEFKFEATEK